MALGTTGISTTLVANTIGEGSNDVGTLCTSNKINKWSFRKPIRLSKNSAITDSDVWSVNAGLNIPVYTNAVTMLNSKNSGEKWGYIRPIGGSYSPYRIGDFREYDNDAVDWYTFLVYNNNIVQGNPVMITMPTLISLYKLDPFKLIGSNLRLGFIISQTIGTTFTSVNYYPVTDSSYPTITDLSENIVLPASLFSSVATYYITPVLSTTNYPVNKLVSIREDNSLLGNWYAFDGNTLNVNIVSAPITNYITGDIITIDIKAQVDGSYTIFELSTTITNSYSEGITVNYIYDINNEAGREHLNRTGSIYITTNSTVTISLIKGDGNDKYFPNGYNISSVDPRLLTTLAYNTQSRTTNIDLTPHVV